MQPFYEPGKYRGVITQQALGKNQKGTPQFVLKVRIVSRILDGEEEGVRVQQERTLYLYLSEGAAPYTIEKLQAIGFTGKSVRQLDLSTAGAHDFRETIVDLMCKHEVDTNGDDREKWDLVWGGSGEIEITPLDAAEARKLDALFAKSLGGAKPPANGQRKAAAPLKPQPVAAGGGYPDPSDEDVPF